MIKLYIMHQKRSERNYVFLSVIFLLFSCEKTQMHPCITIKFDKQNKMTPKKKALKKKLVIKIHLISIIDLYRI